MCIRDRDKIINILLLVIIFVFDPLAISLVVAANFAFDQANKKNLYNEYEDEVEPDLWDDNPWEEEEEDINDIEVDAEVVEVPEDWKVVDDEVKETPLKVTKILQNAPSKVRAKLSDGSQRWIPKKDIDEDNIIRYF